MNTYDSPREFAISHDDIQSFWETPALRFTRRVPKWVERLARRAMRWLGIEVEQKLRTRTFRVPRSDSFLHGLRLQQRDMLMLYNQQARYMFIGPAALDGAEMELRNGHVFSLGQPQLELLGARGIKQILGVEVVLVPWMEGVLLMPEWTSRH